MKITSMLNSETVLFAKQELEKHLEKLGVGAEITLGLFDNFGINLELEDPYFDDAIAISVKDKKGYIAGSNERSILIGVYRLLEQWGITWVRPGVNGIQYPEKCDAADVEICEKAAKRHRTMCIEGAVSLENVLDMVEWLPKVGFNGYFIQFSHSSVFFERWYNHLRSTVKQPENYTSDMAVGYVDKIVAEIKKRGLQLQRMGHGWTCIAYGVPDHGWHQYSYEELPQKFHDACALVNGKRACWNNSPLQTQLCYSNPEVRSAVVGEVLKYAEAHPECDVIHFWVGDALNNYCECENCSTGNHTDHYVRMLNDITDAFVEKGLKTKVVAEACLNLSWAPATVEIKNRENVILMFAPITRTFGEAFPDTYRIKEVPEFKPNSFTKPSGVDENLAYLHDWLKVYDGDTVDFDYHLMWDHILDAGGEGIAKVIHTDIKSFEALGINGLISCQLQRNAFPTSIAMTVMAKTLWNTDTDFEKTRRELYEASFGVDAVDVLCDYFSLLSESFDIGVIRAQKSYDKDEVINGMQKAINAMESFRTVIFAHLNSADPCHRDSWKYLELHGHMYTLLAKAIIAKLSGDMDAFTKLRDESVHYCFENEDILQPVLDGMFYCRMTNERINIADEIKRDVAI